MRPMDGPAFHDPAAFGFIAELCRHARDIHREFLRVQERLTPYLERQLHNDGWSVLGLWNLPHRESLPPPQDHCPFTAQLVEQLVPRHGAVAFSVLAPGAIIQPHRGRPGPFLRCHLALEVPEGDCAIRVGNEVRGWRSGEALVLDDRQEHEAWNRTSQRRVVLLLDFEP